MSINDKTGVEALDWTDLVGYQKRTLLTELPAHMGTFLLGASLVATRQVWTKFAAMMKVSSNSNVIGLHFHRLLAMRKIPLTTLRVNYSKPASV